ncbi:MAG: hypothetical protein KDA85_17535 [Planctomycetaceae bacterium]|nr:hypothetical protein [Planctomycetaceae bacterium]
MKSISLRALCLFLVLYTPVKAGDCPAAEPGNDAKAEAETKAAPRIHAAAPIVIAPPRLHAPGAAVIEVRGECVPPAFDALPDVRSVGSNQGAGASSDSATGLAGISVFEQACHFPLMATARDGRQLVQDAAVIYEGMQVSVHQDGTFELDFMAEIPRTAVTLRLQLYVSTAESSPIATITIPPIVIEPDNKISRHDVGQAVHVVHRGYSNGLRRAIERGEIPRGARPTNWNTSETGILITRGGTARFGSKPEKGEYAIRPSE